ncbi:MAG: response regulator transcription factor [Clostridiaceae bacterium]|nr:response regulator transcription factor [Clostridiaceae bacterium]
MMSEKKTVLLVEDNRDLNYINSRALRLSGYQVLTALTVAKAREHLAQFKPDAIILDILLPDGNGVDFCREIREQTAAPILFLTSVSGVDKALEGIRAGGDDYITKPFHIELLLARLEAFWRRDEISKRVNPADLYTCGPLTFQTAACTARLNGEDMMVTVKEFLVLLLLAQNEGNMVSKEVIYKKVWGQPLNGNSQALYAVVSRLKKKLENTGGGVHLNAMRPDGYRLTIQKDDEKDGN